MFNRPKYSLGHEEIYVCGLYYTLPNSYRTELERFYLPQVSLQAHSTILSTTSRTILTQAFVNPSDTKGIKEVRYTFPLYDGVSVVGFTCHIGDRTIVGEVKEKEKAKQVFQEAVAKGETAGLLEQLPEASDVFTTTVGNIPPGANVIVKITYLGELKHDMEVDGIRFTIPNIICPRYGKYPLGLTSNTTADAVGTGIEITVDAEMADGSFIQQIQSPSHPISVSMGTTSFAPNAEPKMNKASATLSLGTAQLDTDFILQIISKDSGIPKAILETHPTIPNQRALMATLVPKFSLPAEKPEVVFVCDRSGSMSGSRINLVIQALKVFLKSLPVGVKFNICSFGSSHSFLWPKSVTYSQQTLDQAVRHVELFQANFGGTEMYQPIKATLDQRYKDIPLEVMLLTDGEIWDQQRLFSYLNQEVAETKVPIRVFTLGIGNGVSHSLIEGIARAGNGFSQTVGEGEKMDSKVVRMLKGALSPHVDDYTLEVKYSDNNSKNTSRTQDDDFEIVERVADSLTVKIALDEKKEEEKPKKPISLFDATADPDKDFPPPYDESGEARYSHLPNIMAPKIIQAPQNIPALFAFNRTSVYLLLGPEAPQQTPQSVILKGTSQYGPLELEIPIQILDMPGETIHQLAAKKAIFELEQGRGWLPEAKDESSKPLKEKFESRFSDMVEREAVRLGVRFQVGGKYCSFVAIERNRANRTDKELEEAGYEVLDDPASVPQASAPVKATQNMFSSLGASSESKSHGINISTTDRRKSRSLFGGIKGFFGSSNPTPPPPGGSLFSLAPQSTGSAALSASFFGNAPQPTGLSTLPSYSPANYASIPPPPPPQPHPQSPHDTAAAELAVTQNLLHNSIQSVTERGEKLDTLTARTAALSTQSQEFYTKAKKSSTSFGRFFGESAPAPTTSTPPPPSAPVDTSTTEEWKSRQAPAHTRVLSRKIKLMALQAPDLDNQSQALDRICAKTDTVDDSVAINRERLNRIEGSRERSSPLSPPTANSSAPSTSKASGVSAETSAFGSSNNTQGGFGSAPVAASASASPFSFGSAFGAAPAPAPTASSSPFGNPRAKPFSAGAPAPAPTPTKPKTPDEILEILIALQTFEGFWEWSVTLFSALSINPSSTEQKMKDWSLGLEKRAFATALAIAYFETKLVALQGSWELVVDKARGWLEDNGHGGDLIEKARGLL